MKNNSNFNEDYKIETLNILVIDYVNECVADGTSLPVNKSLAEPFVLWAYNHEQSEGWSFNEILFRVLVTAHFRVFNRFITYSYLKKEMKIRYYELVGLIAEAVVYDIGMDDPTTDSIIYNDVVKEDAFFEFSFSNRNYLLTRDEHDEYHSYMVSRFREALKIKTPPAICDGLRNSLTSMSEN